MPNPSHTSRPARFLPPAADRPEWQPGHNGRAYVLRSESPQGPQFRLVTWLAQGSLGSAEAMQADGINLRDPRIDWALLRISPSGAFTLTDPRDTTAPGSRRLDAMSAGVRGLDTRLKQTVAR